ncbi:hypothetical protein F5884DRAFT_864312 [Xylogone sp. PMI_703]|nr:hypothetical protein F5884DRAFT_864312 [Xylogone sp. PMI_703]
MDLGLGPTRLPQPAENHTLSRLQYKPYDEDKALDRVRLERRGLSLSDELLNAYFDPFRRERRVYERLDRRTTGLERTFFLEYYGDIQIPNSAGSDSSDSRMIVLELLQNRRPVVQKELSLTDDLISRAKQLRSNMDDEGVHCLIHLYEIFDALHRFEIIHSDIKPDMLADYLVAGRPVLYDFSESWAYKKGFHRLDPFKNHPRYFDEDRKRELNDIDRMVLKDNKAPPEKKELRRKFPAIKECGRCEKVLADIIGEQ